MRLFLAISLSCVFVSVSLAAPTDEVSKADPDYRLNEDVIPFRYDIVLTPYLLSNETGKQFKFDGVTSITIKAQHDNVKEIVLHSKNLHNLQVALAKQGSIFAEDIEAGTPDPVTNKLSIKLTNALETSRNYTLQFFFDGQMDDDMHGFYRSKYITVDNAKDVWIGSTQFQTNHARRAFPCFDEPQFKAVFSVQINCEDFYTVMSNTNPINPDPESINGRRSYIFKDTPLMSTYLLAFLVSDFKTRSNVQGNFSIVSRTDAYDQTAYSLEVGPKLLDSLNRYTGINYYSVEGIEKMDLAAIPDFSAGAMENWGFLTYRETALLYSENDTTSKSQQSIAGVIAHEQAHMWFGDLVTCKWWGYTWLNEGFARYFQYFTTHEVEPEWEMDKQFVVEQIQSVFVMDSLNDTNPMTDETVASPADLSRMFSSISYNKGASIIRMINYLIGQDTFKSGIQKYLDANKYGPSTPDLLFSTMEQEWNNNNINLTEIWVDWTTQVGYPVVTFKPGKDKKTWLVSQKRFLLDKDAGDSTLKWNIPLTFTTSNEKNFTKTKPEILLTKDVTEYELTFESDTDWIIGNIQETGYYRVDYDHDTWEKIGEALKEKEFGGIHELNRAQIIDDIFNLCRAGSMDYDHIFHVLDYIPDEDSYVAWYSAFTGLSYLAVRLGSSNSDVFHREIQHNLEKIYDRLGFEPKEDDKRVDIYNRVNVLSWACKYDHSDCIQKANEQFKALFENNEPVNVNLRSVVYCTAIRENGKDYFDFLWKKFQTENVAAEQVLILGALGCSKDKDTLNEYLGKILKEVRLQDRSSALSGTYTSNVQNIDIVFDYVAEHYKEVAESFGGIGNVASILSGIASRITTSYQKEKLLKFHNDHQEELGSSAQTIQKALETIDANIQWSNTYLPKFIDELKTRNSAWAIAGTNIVLILALAFTRFLY